MEIKKTYTSSLSSFSRITIRPIISDIFIKNIYVINTEGATFQLDISPFVLEEDTTISNSISNSVAVVITASHDYISDSTDIDECMTVNISKSGEYAKGSFLTKPVKIMVRDIVSPVIKIENQAGVVISSKIGIRGFDEFDTELFNESVTVGLGDSREIISSCDTMIFEPESIRMVSLGVESADNISFSGKKILNYQDDCTYIYKPKYLSEFRITKLSDNISIDNNNNILLNKKTKYIECSILSEVYDINNSSPVIKYIGIMSR